MLLLLCWLVYMNVYIDGTNRGDLSSDSGRGEGSAYFGRERWRYMFLGVQMGLREAHREVYAAGDWVLQHLI